MVIGIDASSAAKPVRTGVEQYAFQLIQRLKTHALAEGERVRLYSPLALPAPLGELPTGWESAVLDWRFSKGWMRLRVGWEMRQRPPDVLFVPSQGLPLFTPRIKGRATVTTIHDLGFLRAPALYDPSDVRRLRSATARSVRLATRILTVSEFSKREIMDVYRVPAGRITVTPLAADTAAFHPLAEDEVRRVRDAYRLGPHYFLCVGRIERKKNPLTAVRAFEMFKERRGAGDPYELVFVGSPGFGFDEVKRYLQFHPLRDHVRFLPYLPEAEVAALMNGATAFLFPSWYEGFGIPSVEAMACGTAVIASDIPVHREVLGDAALFVPPSQTEAWAEAMRRVVEESGLRANLRERGPKRATLYSWEKTAEQTWNVLTAK